MSSGTYGAYGVRLPPPLESDLLVPGPPSWPLIDVERRLASLQDSGVGPAFIEGDRARLPLAERGRVDLHASPLRAVFTTSEPLDDDLVIHPYLAPVAAIHAHWSGREALHGGAVVAPSGAWALLGSKGAGKSTSTAAFARQGVEIVSDDLLVVDTSSGYPMLMAGPRCVDLRPDAALRFGQDEPVIHRPEPRYRVRLPPVGPELPFAGWVELEWGDGLEISPIPARERLGVLARHRSVALAPHDPRVLLEIAALPAFRLCRARSWDTVDAALQRLRTLTGI